MKIPTEITHWQTVESDTNFLLHLPYDDPGHADCVLALYPDRFRWSSAMGWLVWNGKYWAGGDEAEAEIRFAVETTLRKRIEATSQLPPDEMRKSLKCIPNTSRVNAILPAIKARVTRPPKEPPPHLLNCNNGIVDLRTGELLPHSPLFDFTWAIPTDFDYLATSDEWEKLLLEWMVTQERVDYTQTAMGYTLTGDTREECMFVLYGPGRSGKGSFCQTIEAILGSGPSRGIHFSAFTDRRSDPQGFLIAPLCTARMIIATESDHGSQFSEEVVKRVTGRDTLTVSFKGKTSFDFRPIFKVWLQVNDFPRANPDDDAFWRRVRVIEFPISHVGEEDKGIKTRLLEKDNQTAILTWMVKGAMRWYHENGLAEPFAITTSTEKRRADNDMIQPWLDEHVEVTWQEEDRISSKDAFASWSEWMREQGHHERWSQRRFNDALRKKFQPLNVQDNRVRMHKLGVQGTVPTTAWTGIKWSEGHEPAAPTFR